MDDASKINVDEIMSQIRSDIKKYKKEGRYSKRIFQSSCTLASVKYPDTDNLRISSDIKNDSYRITSHRKIVGIFLKKARQIVNGEVARYVDPIVQKQTVFNNLVVGYLNSLVRAIEANQSTARDELRHELYNDLEEKFSILERRIISTDEKLTALAQTLNQEKTERLKYIKTEANREVAKSIHDSLAIIDKEINNKQWLLNLLDGHGTRGAAQQNPYNIDEGFSSLDYPSFSDEIGKAWLQIGGYPPVSSNIFDDSVKLFKKSNNVLDIGSGTGQFLEKLRQNGIDGYGIDVCESYVSYCNSLGLRVICVDAISHLKSLKDNSLGGIFISQVVEHLPIKSLDELIKLSYMKLQPGGHLVIAMPNITSMLVSTNLFYLDPTHKTHLHPEVLKFLLQSNDFKNLEDRYYQPVSESVQLKKIDLSNITVSDEQRSVIEHFNYNVDILNKLLFGYRDYAVISIK
ncbi:class I SAM-dependent methyltransferase [Methanocella arvoryzae]|uniref:Predicted SAM-dependent methyltransferase n=1 Tax=Methanocella arvoryzae (strain DSM 22066 / NBRC 105507 / MRE50) TaxID=351160 RepID=Q0W7E9_METAR|nr:class I SAM-dependent methyltransferase [Methanocella arvoryzae]CAJ35694.1 predicted SAM-dependent methyltransferase [Methanocella arvoryzae MRE50]